MVAQVPLGLVDRGRQLVQAGALFPGEKQGHAVELEPPACRIVADLQLSPGLKATFRNGLNDAESVVAAVRRKEVCQLRVCGLRVLPGHLVEDPGVDLDFLVVLDALESLAEAVLLAVAEDPDLAAPDIEGLVLGAEELPASELLRVDKVHLALVGAASGSTSCAGPRQLFCKLNAAGLLKSQPVAELNHGV